MVSLYLTYPYLASECYIHTTVDPFSFDLSEGALLGPLQRMKGRVEVLEGLPTVDLEGSVEPQQPQQ